MFSYFFSIKDRFLIEKQKKSKKKKMNENLRIILNGVEYILHLFDDNLMIEAKEISSFEGKEIISKKLWKSILTPNNFREKLAHLKSTTHWEQLKMLIKEIFKDESKLSIHNNQITKEIALECKDEQLNFFFGKFHLKLISFDENGPKIKKNFDGDKNENDLLLDQVSTLKEKLLNLELFCQDLNSKIEKQNLRFEEILSQNQEKIIKLEETVENQNKTIRGLTEISKKKENIFKDYVHLEETVSKLTNKFVTLFI